MIEIRRVLHLVSSLSINSGVMNVLMNYYRRIDRKDIQFDFLYFIEYPESVFRQEIESLGGRVFRIRRPSPRSASSRELSALFQAQGRKGDIVHIHTPFLTFLVAPIAHRFGLRVVVHNHSAQFGRTPLRSMRNQLLCLPVNALADGRMACSRAAGAALFGQRAVESGEVRILNNAVDLEAFAFSARAREDTRRLLGLEGAFVVGNVGRLSVEKNHGLLLRAFAALHSLRRSCKLLRVGDGALRVRLGQQCAERGIAQDVLFLGRRGDIPALLSAMDVFVLPSLFEGMPVAAVEAQASGLPCVMSDTITREAGVVNSRFLPLDAAASAWAEAILEAAGSVADRSGEGICSALAAAGFSIRHEARNLAGFYDAL